MVISRAMAGLIPNEIGNRVVNLALGGGSPIEAYYIANRTVGCAEVPRRVIISLSMEQFIRSDCSCYWTRSAVFNFLSFGEMEEVRLASRRLGDRSIYPNQDSFGIVDFVTDLSYHAGLPSYYFAAMVHAGFIGRKERNLAVLEETLRNRGHYLFGKADRTDWPGPEATLAAFKPAPIMTEYFEKLIALFQRHGVPVDFVAMPINELSAKVMNTDLRVNFLQYLEYIKSRHTNFSVIGDILPTLPPEYFGDPEHLNEAGAAAWSRALGNALSTSISSEAMQTRTH